VAILGGILWYTDQNKRGGPAFDPARQFIPQGAESLEVPQALASFNFSEPLPFFEERNVVQSLMLGRHEPTVTQNNVGNVHNATSTARQGNASSFLNYQIFGQSREAVRNAFIQYFKDAGWNRVNTSDNQSLIFSSRASQMISITLLDGPANAGTNQPTLTVGLSIW